jgi:hypothetical protein
MEMETLSPTQVIAPFAKINQWRQPDGTRRIRAYILIERPFEGAKTGVAIDGSASMRLAYGFAGGVLGLISSRRSGANLVNAEARKMCAYLARSLDVDGCTASIYWGTGRGSREYEVIGDLTEAQASTFDFGGPKHFGGGGTSLLPALRYFVERFAAAKWGMYVFITDGVIDDLEDVKKYTIQLARSIEAGDRQPLKLVMIGVGSQVDENQMVKLDDLDTGTNQDLWDHKIAKEMGQLAEIFAEVVDETVIVADHGVVRDAKGRTIRDFRDTGLPALLEFTLPTDASNAFSLEVGGRIIRQPLP